jgi:uncharacterized protein
MIFHSALEYKYLWLPFFGLIIGLFGSMIGGGGGLFFIPVLILLFKVPVHIAIATSLAATLPICILGSIGHYRNGNTDFRTGLIFIFGGIAGAFSGAVLANYLNTRELKIAFGIYSVLLAVHLMVSSYKKQKEKAKGEKTAVITNSHKIAKGSAYGFLAGTITGAFGTSGSTPVVAGLFAMNMPIKLVLGTSLMVVFSNTLAALGSHFLVGKIDLTLVYLLTSGTVIGAFAGPRLLNKVKIERAEFAFQQWYGLSMIIFGIALIIT